MGLRDCGIFWGASSVLVVGRRRWWCCASQQTANDGAEAAWGFIRLIIPPHRGLEDRTPHGKSTRGLEGPESSLLRQS